MSVTYEKFIEYVKSYNPDEVERVKKAYELAKSFHEGQYRQSGEEYITHPLNVAYILATMHADGDTLCAGLLHDVLEDTSCSKEEIIELFNEDVANLVEGVSEFRGVNFSSKSAKDAANTRKLLMGLKSDARIMIIKLADRLHNMRTLEFKSKEKQIIKARETETIFAPMAGYLGAYGLKKELEDLSLKFFDENSYNKIVDYLESMKSNNEEILLDMLYKIQRILDSKNIPNDIIMRTKNIYGIYKQMLTGHGFKDIHDLIALKILVDEVDDCYLSLGVVHQNYTPINSLLKDYIYSPKTNMYRGLHTTVAVGNERLVQVRIKTNEMDKMDTNGIIAYWDLNHEKGKDVMQSQLSNHFQFFRTLGDIDDAFEDDEDFMRQLKSELFSGKIYVATMNGKIIELPTDSTIIDFAYALSEDVGNHINMALINGVPARLDQTLKTYDRVQIITGKEPTCIPDKLIRDSKTTRVRKKL